MKKKILSSLLAVCMIVSLCSISGAVDETQKEFIFESDICQEKVQLIIDTINGEEVISPRSNTCVFGHILERIGMKEVTHKYYSDAPRCLSKEYDVVYCSRSSCNYIIYNLVLSLRIHCCE